MTKREIPALDYRTAKGILARIGRNMARQFNLKQESRNGQDVVWSSTDNANMSTIRLIKDDDSMTLSVFTTKGTAHVKLAQDKNDRWRFYAMGAMGERGVRWAHIVYGTYRNAAWEVEDHVEEQKEEAVDRANED